MYKILEPKGLIHFSTTIHNIASEGFEEKEDYSRKSIRFRKRWTLEELNNFLENENINIIHQYLIKDPLGKNWVNTITN